MPDRDTMTGSRGPCPRYGAARRSPPRSRARMPGRPTPWETVRERAAADEDEGEGPEPLGGDRPQASAGRRERPAARRATSMNGRRRAAIWVSVLLNAA